MAFCVVIDVHVHVHAYCIAQYSTPDSIKQDMRQYEKITLEAAAQVRQKWTETQGTLYTQ